MRVLVVGKYPPIEGGTCTQTFATIRGLLERGHDVDVLTNADEAEVSCRQMFLPEDFAILERLTSPVDGGNITVHQTEQVRDSSYIPWAQPYLSKMFGIGMNLLRSTRFDLVVGWYMEPYGVAAAQIAHVAGARLLLTHAGSDIGRLGKHHDLRLAYRWSFRQADYVLTSEALSDTLVDLGARPESLVTRHRGGGAGVPDYFSKPPAPLDFETFAPLAIERFEAMEPPESTMQMLRDNLERRPIIDQRPVIGVYGKVGETKGSYDLLAALENLASRAVPFTLVALVGGQPGALYPYIETLESTEHLRNRTVLLPFVAPWRVPEFIDACDLVCFLERRFPISAHSPMLAREVLKRGRALMLSAEVAQKSWFHERLVDGENYILVSDPSEVEHLTERLERNLSDLSALRQIGENGGKLAEDLFGSDQSDAAAATIDALLSGQEL
jgi:glycosyltransferase involved in cell wall biosynthesis